MTTQLQDVEREAFPLPDGCREGYITTNGIRLHYVAAGAEAGPLVLLLHGFPEFWYSWRAQLPALARLGRRVVALDLRGYNLSDRPAHGYDLAMLAADIRGAIAAFGERQADIIGHDWGGVLAWVMGIREPDYVRRLAVLNAPHPGTITREMRSLAQLRRSSYVAFFQLPIIPERTIARDDYSFIWRTFRASDRERAWLSDDDIQRYITAIERPGALTAALNYYRVLIRHGAATLGPTRVIAAPTLLLWGDQDPYLGPAMAENLEPWVRDLTVHHYPNLGHWTNQQAPQRVNEALLAFLA